MRAESNVRRQPAPRGHTVPFYPDKNGNHEPCRLSRARDGPDGPGPGPCGRPGSERGHLACCRSSERTRDLKQVTHPKPTGRNNKEIRR